MNVIFLDIDGVLNCSSTKERHRGFIGIDENILKNFKKIFEEVEVKIVLSSTWRLFAPDVEYLKIDITPSLIEPAEKGYRRKERGYEIQSWLDKHPEVENYLILDDDSDMLSSQNFFKTNFKTGLTKEGVEDIIAFFRL